MYNPDLERRPHPEVLPHPIIANPLPSPTLTATDQTSVPVVFASSRILDKQNPMWAAFSLNKFIYVIYLFLAALGLRCCARAFSSCGDRGLLFVVVLRLLMVVASLVAEHGL